MWWGKEVIKLPRRQRYVYVASRDPGHKGLGRNLLLATGPINRLPNVPGLFEFSDTQKGMVAEPVLVADGFSKEHCHGIGQRYMEQVISEAHIFMVAVEGFLVDLPAFHLLIDSFQVRVVVTNCLPS